MFRSKDVKWKVHYFAFALSSARDSIRIISRCRFVDHAREMRRKCSWHLQSRFSSYNPALLFGQIADQHHAINYEYYFFPLAQSWYDIGTISLVFGWFKKGIYCPLFRVELIVFVMDLSLLSNFNLCQSFLSVLKPGKMISQRKKKKIFFVFCFLVLFW